MKRENLKSHAVNFKTIPNPSPVRQGKKFNLMGFAYLQGSILWFLFYGISHINEE